ncbi:MAG: DNA repair protein RecO [Betaproteobacteria bacterium RBG_16_64_9]|nr:MAG: DNA repair protein RecO [Betaproteobacteria bacterium RBG_16_64_9]OGA23817.1 MAG: DNA repair protein RecO [Betaproteobacteria bacterium RIFCSPLOWO2_02_FULL_65_24]OGA95721.1 MAG: DNA repair protein RecO [Betaproteobacteria bacterium RIFCSPLOWO2_12_FULL_66_14]
MAERMQQIQQAFVLHTYPYRETSLLVEALTRGSGRITLVARGARRPRSLVRGMLMAFQPLLLAWYGKSEVKTLAQAEWQGGQPLLCGEALLCGFYLNELLVRLLAREDPHEDLFERYRQALEQLAAGAPSAPILRAFEKTLLKELGYAMTLDREACTGRPIDPEALYTYDPERGPLELNAGSAELQVTGQTLLDLARDDLGNPRSLLEAKGLMRALINHRLDFQPLNSRRIFRELLEL